MGNSSWGGGRVPSVEPVGLEIPNLVLTLLSTDAPPYDKWLDDFVVKSNNSDDRERKGDLVLLSAVGAPILGLAFEHLGIVRVTRVILSKPAPRSLRELPLRCTASAWTSRRRSGKPGERLHLEPPTGRDLRCLSGDSAAGCPLGHGQHRW
jgi:hypothetical protein